MGLAQGKIIYINQRGTFGFIRNYIDNKNYYVEKKNFLDNLKPEDEVEFYTSETTKAFEAIKVKRI